MNLNKNWQTKSTLWDTFQDTPIKITSNSLSSGKLNYTLIILKVFVYVIVFGAVLSSAVVSMLTYIFMTSHLHQKRILKECNMHDTNFFMDYPKEEKFAWLWCLILAFAVPNTLSFFRAFRFCFFKDIKSPTWIEFFLVAFPEILHTTGLAVLSFTILPHLDILDSVVVCGCVSFLPSLLNLCIKTSHQWKLSPQIALNVVAFLIQLSTLLVWPLLSESILMRLLGLPLLLISLRWWENYIQPTIFGQKIDPMLLSKSRYKTYTILAPLKILVFALIGFFLSREGIWNCLSNIAEVWRPHFITPKEILPQTQANLETALTKSQYLTLIDPKLKIYLLLCQIFSSYCCYVFAKFACKIKIQNFSFILPICLTGPVTLAIVIFMKRFDIFTDSGHFFKFIALNTTSSCLNFGESYLWLWFLWWVAQAWTQRGIWSAANDKNALTEKLFVCPWYCGFLVGQCIAMNRRIADFKEVNPELDTCSKVVKPEKIPQLFVCATMWHENQEEMMTFLKSIIRLDEDQCARRMAKIYLNGGEPDNEYYELETNIFFDDAFDLERVSDDNIHNPSLNEYARSLITSIEKAATEEYGTQIYIKPPTKYETPYGGRLVWVLPGRTKLVAHLKNKDQVRHKKRWSQVMYMYYILGYRIMELDLISAKRRVTLADNTYILALDGDIDFQPQAVHCLIGRMKVVDELGAVCGRIHPVGRGLMVWYQIFEYAIGHWLQKSTEHVIGCVLCSPGCFSLFRGSALMRNGVMRKYTTIAEKPGHYIQYDQGEDRWLCTLLLKQGMRVEYSAASDAYTHSPETFNEFYNQRRRWIPSTIANIFDLLSDSEIIVKKNCYISSPYIAYQVMLMVGTVLGPGTIFLMMVGAFVTVFSINIWTAFLWNFIPVFSFILFCVYLNQKFQLLLAFVISSMYCLVMMAVLIGVIIQIIEDGPLAPASVFFLIVFCQILIAGLVHPQEMEALFCGVIYYLTIPSMYMLLLIYSIFNMNDVSWGTREVVKPKPENKPASSEANEKSEQKSEVLTETGWINDPLLLHSTLGEIPMREKRFWKDLIAKYLKPLYHTKEIKNHIALSLKEMRNLCAFAFLMINSIFVLIVFLLQLHKDYLHLEWPIGPIDEITYDDVNSQIYIYRRYKELDPIGLCFVLFFGFILIIQFMAMLVHRFSTLSQILATTTLNILEILDLDSAQHKAKQVRGNSTDIAYNLQKPKSQLGNGVSSEGMQGFQSMYCGNYDSEYETVNHYTDLQHNFEQRYLGEEELKLGRNTRSKESIAPNKMRTNARHRLTAHV